MEIKKQIAEINVRIADLKREIRKQGFPTSWDREELRSLYRKRDALIASLAS